MENYKDVPLKNDQVLDRDDFDSEFRTFRYAIVAEDKCRRQRLQSSSVGKNDEKRPSTVTRASRRCW